MLDMKSKSIKESREGFNALRTYAEKESSDIAGSIVMLADTLSSIENYHERMIQHLRQDYLSILNKLLQDFEGLQQFLKEVELLENNVEKAKQQVAKIQGKPPQNLKPGELQNAEEKLTKLQKELDENKQKASQMTEDYQNKKRDAFQKVFQVLFSNSKEFHSDSLTALYILDGDNSKAPEDTEEGSDEPKNDEIS